MDPIDSVSEQRHFPQFHANLASTSVRINADNSNKKAVLAFWLIFAIFQIIIFITSNFTPESLTIKTNQTQLSATTHNQCQNPIEFTNGMLSCRSFSQSNPKLGLIMRNLSPLNQFAQINLLYIPKKTGSSIIIKQDFAFELLSLNRKEVVINQNEKKWMFEEGVVIKKMERSQFDSSQTAIQELDWYNGTHQMGFDINLGFYRQFVSEDALLVITFLDLDKQSLQNYDIVPVATLMNQSYTKFVMIFRAIFLGITTLTFVYFFRQHKEAGQSLQHTIILFLSGAIILFNDPYYFIEVFQPNLISVFISTIFIAVYFNVLILSWVCFLEKIKKEGEGQEFIIYPRKKMVYGIISSLFFIAIFIINFQIGYYSFSKSPIIPNHFIFNGLYIFFIIFLALIFLYIMFLYFGIFRNWGKIIWRNKIYATFNIFFILLNFIFIWLGWFSFYTESSQKFQIFYASMNFYVIYLQYMYSLPFFKKQELNEEYVQQIQESSEVNNEKIVQGCITIQLESEFPKMSQISQ